MEEVLDVHRESKIYYMKYYNYFQSQHGLCHFFHHLSALCLIQLFFYPVAWYSKHLLERTLNSLGQPLLFSHVPVWKQTLVQYKDILYLWLFSCCWVLQKNTMDKLIWFHFESRNINSVGNLILTGHPTIFT